MFVVVVIVVEVFGDPTKLFVCCCCCGTENGFVDDKIVVVAPCMLFGCSFVGLSSSQSERNVLSVPETWERRKELLMSRISF